MRVAIVAPVSLGLLGRPGAPFRDVSTGAGAPIISHLANALLARGIRVSIVTQSIDVDRRLDYDDGDLTISVCPARRRGRARDLFATERRTLAAAVRDHAADVVHAHWTYEYALAALDVDPSALVTVRDDALAVLRYFHDPYRVARLILHRETLRRARALTATSPYLRSRLPAPVARRTVVVPNFWNADLAALRVRRSTEPATDRSCTVVTVANGSGSRKNVTTALRAHHLLRRAGADVRLHLIGRGLGAGEKTHAFARDRDLTEAVEFLGYLPYRETMARMAAADVLLHPSLEEAFGMTLLEAMVLDTPVVAGRGTGNPPHLLGDGSFGMLCDATDALDVAATVGALLEEPCAASRMAASARRHAEEHYREAVVVPKYLEAYARVLTD